MPSINELVFRACGLVFSVRFPDDYHEQFEVMLRPFVHGGQPQYHLRVEISSPPGFQQPDFNIRPTEEEARRFFSYRVANSQQIEVVTPIVHVDVATAALGALVAFALSSHEGLVLHASAIAFSGQAHVLVGPSGSGKTTAACNASSSTCFNDDLVSLRRDKGSWVVGGLPLCGNDKLPGLNMEEVVAGLHVLRKGRSFCLRKMRPVEALARILSQTLVPFPFDDSANRVASVVLALVGDITCDELSFERSTDLRKELSLGDTPDRRKSTCEGR